MASIQKFTHEETLGNFKHNMRIYSSSERSHIDKDRSHLNYSLTSDQDKENVEKRYQQILDQNYLYGRGTKREKDAITSCGWVITLPKELYGFKEKEKEFFEGVYEFVCERYGRENILNTAVHYDEDGMPHIHIVFVPVTELNHDQVRYKTIKSKKAVKLESGRYEYEYRYKLEDGSTIPVNEYEPENGIDLRIPLKNYSKLTDYYDTKISASDVLNKAELNHFHQDMQKYLKDNNISGTVINGRTKGSNLTVKELKDITAKTGLTLDEIEQLQKVKEEFNIQDFASYIKSISYQNETLFNEIASERNAKLDFQNQLKVLQENNTKLKEELSIKQEQLRKFEVEQQHKQDLKQRDPWAEDYKINDQEINIEEDLKW